MKVKLYDLLSNWQDETILKDRVPHGYSKYHLCHESIELKIYHAKGHDRPPAPADRHAQMGSREDAAQKAYQEALEEEGIPAYLVELISEQKEMLRASHNEIKAFRDQVVTA